MSLNTLGEEKTPAHRHFAAKAENRKRKTSVIILTFSAYRPRYAGPLIQAAEAAALPPPLHV